MPQGLAGPLRPEGKGRALRPSARRQCHGGPLADQMNTLIEGLDLNCWRRMLERGFVAPSDHDKRPLDYPSRLQRHQP